MFKNRNELAIKNVEVAQVNALSRRWISMISVALIIISVSRLLDLLNIRMVRVRQWMNQKVIATMMLLLRMSG